MIPKIRIFATSSLLFALVALAAGQEMASKDTKALRPVAENAPVPAASPAAQDPKYVVGPSDVLRVSVWKEPDLTQTVVVRPDGYISMPLLGDLRVDGMSTAKIQDLLASKLSAFVLNPQVTVSVSEIHSKMVYITGEIGRPGAYPIVSPMTVLQLIAKAGGLTQFANRKSIVVLRNEGEKRTQFKLDYKQLVRGQGSDLGLQSGDTVVVP